MERTCPFHKKMNSYHNSCIRRKLVLGKKVTRTHGAAGNCWREHPQRFEKMTPEEQLHAVSERAGFIRTVSKGMYWRTGEDVNDGFGNLVASCLENTLSRTHQDSEAQLWTNIYTEIGPVLEVKVICHHDVDVAEIEIPLHLETTPKFVWSYPEAQIATWMSCDTGFRKSSWRSCSRMYARSRSRAIDH